MQMSKKFNAFVDTERQEVMEYLTIGVVLLCMSYATAMVVAHTSDALRARAARKKEEEIKRILDLISK